eukprot:gnl/MRDRNA2_/MRDRNA2_81271_c0_seq1.p2 gnl/MRDRNA2_/MRDRNA2_81271_c0~~gnl/MRDRNA2_/MRDRNA2_81271_c0_seq1.p2  ORF type:complete len:142 (+),score=9.52 gnl/MRDRNA2_/MRDRNA2_81271_c0_seq1:453-878(+)
MISSTHTVIAVPEQWGRMSHLTEEAVMAWKPLPVLNVIHLTIENRIMVGTGVSLQNGPMIPQLACFLGRELILSRARARLGNLNDKANTENSDSTGTRAGTVLAPGQRQRWCQRPPLTRQKSHPGFYHLVICIVIFGMEKR